MDVKDYQLATRRTAIYPKHRAIEYLLCGLASEVGEALGCHKKYIRDDGEELVYLSSMESEIGDVLWYVSELCNELNFDMGDVMTQNIKKLASRKERGAIKGSGDNR